MMASAYIECREGGFRNPRDRRLDRRRRPVAVIAMFTMVVALNFFETSWLADELQPFLALFLTWFGGWTLLRLRNHRRAIDALGASAVSDR
jgi:hypothetical protein